MHSPESAWRAYVKAEMALLEPILLEMGYALEVDQPHVAGERYLMQALTTASGKKLILLGSRISDAQRVVIKATRDPNGRHELQHERRCRTNIHLLPFAYHAFSTPKELAFEERGGFLLSIQEFIEQDRAFLSRPLPDQFTFALNAFKAQEGSHAATYEHLQRIRSVFGYVSSDEYISTFSSFVRRAQGCASDTATADSLTRALTELTSSSSRIEQYGGFLTHTDFVPHNFRIRGDDLYLLDYSSLRFGNKHEGWARFLNFMSLHNPELETAFLTYFSDNRAPEELESLRTMRIYRLGEIIWYYLRTLPQSDGNLLSLNTARVSFWSELLRTQLANTPLPSAVREEYIALRDSLRSPEERMRQKDLL